MVEDTRRIEAEATGHPRQRTGVGPGTQDIAAAAATSPSLGPKRAPFAQPASSSARSWAPPPSPSSSTWPMTWPGATGLRPPRPDRHGPPPPFGSGAPGPLLHRGPQRLAAAAVAGEGDRRHVRALGAPPGRAARQRQRPAPERLARQLLRQGRYDGHVCLPRVAKESEMANVQELRDATGPPSL